MIKRILFLVLIVSILMGCTKTDISSNTNMNIASQNSKNDASKNLITSDNLSQHNNENDCWVVYEGKVYDFTNALIHPNMQKAFYRHCGNATGFEEGAKAKHAKSSEARVLNYGNYVGELE